MPHTVQQYSITFLLLGSIISASQIYANTPTPLTESPKTISRYSTFLPVFLAEFALNQGNINQALNIYQAVVEYNNLPNINERALNIALQFDDIDTALNISKLWTQRYPNDVPAMFYLAHLSLKAHQYHLAAKTLNQILQLDPNANIEGILQGIYPESAEARQTLLLTLNQMNQTENPFILVMIAGLEAQNGLFDSALQKVNLALRKRPDTPSFIILKANLYFAANQNDAALQWLDTRSRTQNSPDVGLFEVQHLIRQNRPDDALKKLQNMLKKWSSNEKLLFLAGITSIDIKQFAQAEYYLEQLQNSENYQDQANYYLAVNAERKNNFEQALTLYKRVEGNFYTVSRKNLVAIYLKLQRSGDAMRFLTQERISHPHQASFLYQLQAQILQLTGQRQAAIHLLNEALQQMPDDAELIYTQVLLFDPFKEQERLDDALNRLLHIEPNSPTFLNAYAYTLAQQNRNLKQARKYAEQALSYAPQQASILDTLGYIAFLQNDFDIAVKTSAQAYAISPSLSIGIHYARALYMSGDIQNFAKICDELQRQYPHSDEVKQLQHLLIPNPNTSPS
ncbi:MAG: tetratricopeptide repeat protein [Acinetobacter sp.]|nr:MAG: tetratricopeptide repeat protein [Acinetobacter sp.]